MNWSRLADPRKVDLLVNAMQEGAQARDLAKLTNRETVRQSIRNNLLLDFEGQQKTRFAWGDFATEQAKVQRRLDSDLARLSDVNGHMRQLLDHPPAVPCLVSRCPVCRKKRLRAGLPAIAAPPRPRRKLRN
ncbi:hypothetical protein JOS77_22570 [Chromobacterium haemolyticum]|nr:hypothetical protein JOS77_22570 [Chromobacterium haemolyticum]